ncbi:uncharacterized protein BDV14DRAFT_199176 [Aspergillus stella-maris]|uniref:uncharacterized protein n=1 Tax=Aspergillus stella-maris TaxID=1810926 RepID=UPI003CCCFED4
MGLEGSDNEPPSALSSRTSLHDLRDSIELADWSVMQHAGESQSSEANTSVNGSTRADCHIPPKRAEHPDNDTAETRERPDHPADNGALSRWALLKAKKLTFHINFLGVTTITALLGSFLAQLPLGEQQIVTLSASPPLLARASHGLFFPDAGASTPIRFQADPMIPSIVHASLLNTDVFRLIGDREMYIFVRDGGVG